MSRLLISALILAIPAVVFCEDLLPEDNLSDTSKLQHHRTIRQNPASISRANRLIEATKALVNIFVPGGVSLLPPGCLEYKRRLYSFLSEEEVMEMLKTTRLVLINLGTFNSQMALSVVDNQLSQLGGRSSLLDEESGARGPTSLPSDVNNAIRSLLVAYEPRGVVCMEDFAFLINNLRDVEIRIALSGVISMLERRRGDSFAQSALVLKRALSKNGYSVLSSHERGKIRYAERFVNMAPVIRNFFVTVMGDGCSSDAYNKVSSMNMEQLVELIHHVRKKSVGKLIRHINDQLGLSPAPYKAVTRYEMDYPTAATAGSRYPAPAYTDAASYAPSSNYVADSYAPSQYPVEESQNPQPSYNPQSYSKPKQTFDSYPEPQGSYSEQPYPDNTPQLKAYAKPMTYSDSYRGYTPTIETQASSYSDGETYSPPSYSQGPPIYQENPSYAPSYSKPDYSESQSPPSYQGDYEPSPSYSESKPYQEPEYQDTKMAPSYHQQKRPSAYAPTNYQEPSYAESYANPVNPGPLSYAPSYQDNKMEPSYNEYSNPGPNYNEEKYPLPSHQESASAYQQYQDYPPHYQESNPSYQKSAPMSQQGYASKMAPSYTETYTKPSYNNALSNPPIHKEPQYQGAPAATYQDTKSDPSYSQTYSAPAYPQPQSYAPSYQAKPSYPTPPPSYTEPKSYVSSYHDKGGPTPGYQASAEKRYPSGGYFDAPKPADFPITEPYRPPANVPLVRMTASTEIGGYPKKEAAAHPAPISRTYQKPMVQYKEPPKYPQTTPPMPKAAYTGPPVFYQQERDRPPYSAAYNSPCYGTFLYDIKKMEYVADGYKHQSTSQPPVYDSRYKRESRSIKFGEVIHAKYGNATVSSSCQANMVRFVLESSTGFNGTIILETIAGVDQDCAVKKIIMNQVSGSLSLPTAACKSKIDKYSARIMSDDDENFLEQVIQCGENNAEVSGD